jgi:hypothetical protein
MSIISRLALERRRAPDDYYISIQGGIMTLRKLSKIASIGMTLIGLVVVPPLRAFQAEDATKAVTKRAKKSAKDATSNAASSDTNTTNKPAEKTEGTKSSTDTLKKARSAPANTVSESEISAAKADGKVWVNTESGVYHKGGQWYGATKQGKFMTEQEAKQAGYRAAKSK